MCNHARASRLLKARQSGAAVPAAIRGRPRAHPPRRVVGGRGKGEPAPCRGRRWAANGDITPKKQIRGKRTQLACELPEAVRPGRCVLISRGAHASRGCGPQGEPAPVRGDGTSPPCHPRLTALNQVTGTHRETRKAAIELNADIAFLSRSRERPVLRVPGCRLSSRGASGSGGRPVAAHALPCSSREERFGQI